MDTRTRDTGPGGTWIARTHGRRSNHRSLAARALARARFESAGRRYGGHSGGVTPVPIPNTEVKPACVSASTGVGDPLGNLIRRLHSFLAFTARPSLRPATSGGRFASYRRVPTVVSARSASPVHVGTKIALALRSGLQSQSGAEIYHTQTYSRTINTGLDTVAF